MNTPRYSLLAPTALALLLGACSSTPERHAALERAQQQYALAQADASTGRYAADEMRRAQEALQRAEQARLDRHPRVELDHLAYLAAQRVTLAQVSAAARDDQVRLAGATAERERMLLTQRSLEAQRAEQALVRSQAQVSDQREQSRSDAAEQREQSALQQSRSQSEISALQAQLRELNARDTPRGAVLTLGDMLFDSGRATLTAGAGERIARIAAFLQQHPEQQARIEGHADSQGAEAANQRLSEQRAGAVHQALLRKGVAGARLSSQGLGESQPVASNDSAAGRQENRRVEIVFSAPSRAAAAPAGPR